MLLQRKLFQIDTFPLNCYVTFVFTLERKFRIMEVGNRKSKLNPRVKKRKKKVIQEAA